MTGRRVVVNREEHEIVGVVGDMSRYPAYVQVYVPLARAPQWEGWRAALDLMVVGLAERVERGNGMLRQYLEILLCATGFALLITCANVAKLQLERVTGRAREFTVLQALGAGRWVVAAQMARSVFVSNERHAGKAPEQLARMETELPLSSIARQSRERSL